jgi:hypothetical protein
MAKDFDIGIKVKADSKKAVSSLDKLSEATGISRKNLILLGAAATAAGAAVAIGLSKAIQKASDFEETQSKFSTVFQSVERESEVMAAELAKNFGLSELAAKSLLSNTGDLLTGFNFAGSEALNMAGKVNKLAVDLASFTNATGGAEAVSNALTKALLGEREALKTYGIAIIEADIKAELLARGMEKLTGEALRQAKAQITLDLAYRQSKNAVGDFERTQESFANQTRVLQARWDDLVVTLGTNFLPVATKIVQKLVNLTAETNSLLKSTQNIIKENNVLATTYNVTKKSVLALINPLATIKKMFNDTKNEVKELSKTTISGANQQAAVVTASWEQQVYAAQTAIDEIGLLQEEANIRDIERTVELFDYKNTLLQDYLLLTEEQRMIDEQNQIARAGRLKLLQQNLTSSMSSSFSQSIKGMIDEGWGFNKVMGTIALGIRDAFIETAAKMAAEWVISHGLMSAATLAWKGIEIVASAAVGAANAAVSAFKRVPFPFNIGAAAAAGAAAMSMIKGFFATGTRGFGGGMAMVGERGPELVNLPGGSDVLNNAETRNALSGGVGNGKIINVNLNFSENNFLGTPEEIAQSISNEIYSNLQLTANA